MLPLLVLSYQKLSIVPGLSFLKHAALHVFQSKGCPCKTISLTGYDHYQTDIRISMAPTDRGLVGRSLTSGEYMCRNQNCVERGVLLLRGMSWMMSGIWSEDWEGVLRELGLEWQGWGTKSGSNSLGSNIKRGSILWIWERFWNFNKLLLMGCVNCALFSMQIHQLGLPMGAINVKKRRDVVTGNGDRPSL